MDTDVPRLRKFLLRLYERKFDKLWCLLNSFVDRNRIPRKCRAGSFHHHFLPTSPTTLKPISLTIFTSTFISFRVAPPAWFPTSISAILRSLENFRYFFNLPRAFAISNYVPPHGHRNIHILSWWHNVSSSLTRSTNSWKDLQNFGPKLPRSNTKTIVIPVFSGFFVLWESASRVFWISVRISVSFTIFLP